jgi:hypothetical protein
MTRKTHVPRCDNCDEPITAPEDLRARWYRVMAGGRVVSRLSARFCAGCRETALVRGMVEAAEAAPCGVPST